MGRVDERVATYNRLKLNSDMTQVPVARVQTPAGGD